jgi:glycerol-3-phosphate dehydrogenase
LHDQRENVRYLPGVRLPDSVHVTARFADTLGARGVALQRLRT